MIQHAGTPRTNSSATRVCISRKSCDQAIMHMIEKAEL